MSSEAIQEAPAAPEASAAQPPRADEPSSLRLIATLGMAGLLAGLVLVSVYMGTYDRIQHNRMEAINRAVKKVVPGSESVAIFEVENDEVVPYTGPEGELPEGEVVYGGMGPDGTLIGYGVLADGPGFMDTISVIYGYDPERRLIIGLEVLESRETPGLGDKIAFDPVFLASFEALEADHEDGIVGVPERHASNEVDLISGATISSSYVVSMLNESTNRWVPILSGPEASSPEPEEGGE